MEESLEKFVDVIYLSYAVFSECHSRGGEAMFILISFL